MDNFPKLASTFEQSAFRPELGPRQPERLGECESRKLTTASQGRNLSPFTWNNIKLPTVVGKQRLEKVQDAKQKQQIKQSVITRKTINMSDLIQATKLSRIGQKAKRALNVSIEMKKMLPQKVSPLKSLHERVLVEYEKRLFTGGMKRRQNRSFTQKQAEKLLSKAYETMEIRTNQKEEKMLFNDHLTRTEQRYRNSNSIHLNDGSKKMNAKGQKNRYMVEESQGRSPIPSFRNKKQQSRESSAQNYLTHKLNDSIIVKSPRNTASKNIHSHSINQQMQPYIRRYFTRMAQEKNPDKLKIFVTTNPKYQPLHMNEHNSVAFNQSSASTHKTLIWTKLQSLNVFRQKTSEQYYNHVEGSHVLTSKEKLNELLNGGKGGEKFFYPVSFSFPKEYNDFVQEYDWVLVKMSLKFLIKEIKKFERGITSEAVQQLPSEHSWNLTVCLSDILEDLTRQTKNQPQLKLLKFCLFLESARKKEKLNHFFEKLKTYRAVDINLSQSVYIGIVDWCMELMRLSEENLLENEDAKNILANTLGLENIDYRLIQLLKSYDFLFTNYLPSYLYKSLSSSHNSWLIKPFASSKAAGISLIIDSQGFYTTPDYEYKEYRHRSKYHNKIFMKYIENPFLIRPSGMDYFVQKHIKHFKKEIEKSSENQEKLEKRIAEMNEKVERFLGLEEKFCGRKFDIRQWVMIVCDELADSQGEESGKMTASILFEGRKSPRNNKTLKRTRIYKYHTAYCRFAQKQYSLDTSDPEVHLTNYEMYKKSALKSDRRSPTITKDSKSLNTSILEKSDHFNSLTDETKGRGSEQEEKLKPRKRLGSMVKEEKDSVMMLEELFEYVDLTFQLKEGKSFENQSKNLRKQSSIKKKYDTQLDRILQSVFEASYPHLVHHNGTFELFGVDLLIDEEMNLYLLEVNLNPGCASEREEKLSQEAQSMLEAMFETIMGGEEEKELQETKSRRIEKMNQKLIGSREFIGESDGEVDSQRSGQIVGQKNSNEQKLDQKEKKWILVGQKYSS